MKELEKRLVYLFTGEFFSVIVFVFLYMYSLHPNQHYSIQYVFLILIFILLQGSFYWFIKWRRLKTKANVLPNLNKIYSNLKKMNLILIYIAPVIFLIHMIQGVYGSFIQWSLTVFIYVFAIIEYVNYYHIQLTKYKKGRGKKSSIAKELTIRK
ncbi:general stress protein [Bacillus sp. FJAT-50079]|uniref:general stress protein n=1 Tax=Bacillus sp. FJAT-50079 TaxID=2833577 RepID=UPI001BCA5EEA|nr:general stress protein [Bacillus sp. FJAT-50079]MBS4206552.1 general stress protein [Bacillus sp. FJAT-50079]